MTQIRFSRSSRFGPAPHASRRRPTAGCAVLVLVAALTAAAPLAAQPARPQPSPAAATPAVRADGASPAGAPRGGDYILAIVNQEVVTAGELAQRIARVREAASREKAALPPDAELRHQVLELLIDERVLLTFARDSNLRIDNSEVERAVLNVAAQNQVTLPQLRERLQREGVDYGRFRSNVRDQLLVERAREREVMARIRISDRDIDELIERERAASGSAQQLNLAHILVRLPEGSAPAVEAEQRAYAEAALTRIRSGEPFADVARAVSDDDGSKRNGGEFGMRPVDRLPDVFVAATRGLKPGEVTPSVLRTAAGFHILKVIDRREATGVTVTQTLVRHILLRPSAQLNRDAAVRRLADLKRRAAGGASFEQLARENSEDGSAPQGGSLGWVSPGALVPEFEQAMNALPLGGLSDPVVSRFGVHLIQVIDRRQTALDSKQLREQARNVLREQKFEEAYVDWLRELRARAYVELREPPP